MTPEMLHLNLETLNLSKARGVYMYSSNSKTFVVFTRTRVACALGPSVNTL